MSLDLALEQFSATAPWYFGGLANHGPMAAEALDTLARLGGGVEPDSITGWARWYARRLAPLSEAGPGYLRTLARVEAEIGGTGWESVVRRRVPALVADVAAGSAGHGLLRVAHAVRALQGDDNPVRRRELAHGLAYWITTWKTFTAPVPVLAGDSDPTTALERMPDAGVTERGFFTDVLPLVVSAPAFQAALATAAAPEDVAEALGDLTEAAAGAFVAGGAREPIALVHAVTVPAALRPLLPFLDAPDRSLAYASAWQAVAAFVAGYGAGLDRSGATAERPWPDLAAAALAGRDEHAIKLVGACALENAVHPSPAYAAAATVAVASLGAVATAT